MRSLRLLLCLVPWVLSGILSGEQKASISSILDAPDIKKTEVKEKKEPLLNYENFIQVVESIRANPNQITSEYDLDILQKEMAGKVFLFRDTIRVKTDPYISENKGFWFTPSPMVESFLVMPKELRREYGAVQVYDYITARAKLLKVGRVCHFEAVKVEKVEPFDPRAKFEDFSELIKKMKDLKDGMPYFEYKAKVKRETDELKGVLGHVTGEMISLRRNKESAYVMKLKVHDVNVQVECHPAFLSALLDIEPGTQVSMAVIMERADIRDGYFMARGCLVRL